MINKLKNNYKSLGKSVSNMLFYLKKTTKGPVETAGGSYAMINLDDKIMNQSGGRFSYLLCQYLEQSGFQIILQTNLIYFLVLHPYKKLLLNKPYSFVRKLPTSKNTIVCNSKGCVQKISVVHGLQTLNRKSVSYSLPFPMHPVQVDNFNKRQLADLRRSTRTIRVFFSGSWTQGQYEKPLGEYNVLTRSEVMRFIVDRFNRDNAVQLISDTSELYKLLRGQTFQEKIIISEIKTKDEDWLKFLSNADFFISPPGFKYPWCHNAIEAMSVGAIPILQYNHLFVPALKHMENCICYKNLDELENAITIALAMKKEDVSKMRENVITYFDKHLSPEAIVNDIQQLHRACKDDSEFAMPYIN